MRQVQLQETRSTDQAHILYAEATLAALFFLHLPLSERSPNVAVVDPARGAALRAIAVQAGFSVERLEPIRDLPHALDEFGVRMRSIVESFGFTFPSGTLNNGVLEALHRAAQA